MRILQFEKHPVSGKIDFCYLKTIHRYVFRDIYEWAGEIRTVNISKGVKFCQSEYIEENAKSVFERLNYDNHIDMDESDIICFLAHYLGEINAIHPFREGNGRVQRLFINQLAKSHGYYLDYSKITDYEMIEASHHSFCIDDSKMIVLIKKSLKKSKKNDESKAFT